MPSRVSSWYAIGLAISHPSSPPLSSLPDPGIQVEQYLSSATFLKSKGGTHYKPPYPNLAQPKPQNIPPSISRVIHPTSHPPSLGAREYQSGVMQIPKHRHLLDGSLFSMHRLLPVDSWYTLADSEYGPLASMRVSRRRGMGRLGPIISSSFFYLSFSSSIFIRKYRMDWNWTRKEEDLHPHLGDNSPTCS
jgi:hypothetical protein